MDESIKPIHFDLTIRTERKQIMINLVNHLVNHHNCNFSVESNGKDDEQFWIIKICDYSWRHNLVFITKAIPDLEVDEDEEEEEKEGEEEKEVNGIV